MAADSPRTGISAEIEPGRPAGAPAGARLDTSAWRVIVASSLGAVYEWYDFFLFGAAAQLLSEQFFPAGNAVASRLLVFATFGAGFAVRPAGAFLFGVLGDRVGRKHTFLITIVLMGTATTAMGLLPTFSQSGLLAPALLVFLRLVQGLALGGEYGGAAIYVAEHAPSGRRGLHTSFIQLAGAVGFLLALTVVLAVHGALGETVWHRWGWRIPFLLSFALLAGSVYVRLKLKESPIFEAMKRDGMLAPSPLRESVRGSNLRRMVVALFGISAGLTVTWFTAQFTSLYLLQQWAGLDDTGAKELMAAATLLALPGFVISGWLSDRVGRKFVLLAGYVLSLTLTVPVFHAFAAAANPARNDASVRSPIVVSGRECSYNPFVTLQPSACGRTLSYLTSKAVPYTVGDWNGESDVTVAVGRLLLPQPTNADIETALRNSGYLSPPAMTWGRGVTLIALAFGLILIAALTYGPSAALLVELFPAQIRYTSLSLPYHIGTGYIGGFQPFLSQYISAHTGNPFGGLAYTLAVVAIALVVGLIWLPETRGRPIGA